MDIQAVKQRFGIIGNDEALTRAIEVALRVSSTDLSVLITGESGVGKEFFPQIIHAYSSRKHGNYIAVNCGAIPEGTIDSELFGHEKGSFTGATESRKGYFEMADGGTIFLDEVAELPQTTQVRLLRVLQAGEFIRVGSSKTQKTNVRVVAATNVNLQEAIARGSFREDLYYRLNTVPIAIPPLRERREDIPLLFRKFCTDIANQYKMPSVSLTADARLMLQNYSWQGNVRQLKNVAEQISVIEESREITAQILSKYLSYQNSAPVIVNGTHNFDNGGAAGGVGASGYTDRDIIFNILYDMKHDIAEIKKMLSPSTPQSVTPEVFGVVPTIPTSHVLPTSHALPAVASYGDDIYDTAEIIDVTATEHTKEQIQREAIIKALKRHGGRRKDAAKELFISERTLYRRIKELDIED